MQTLPDPASMSPPSPPPQFFSLPVKWKRAAAVGAAGFAGVSFPPSGLFISQCDGVFEVHLLPPLASLPADFQGSLTKNDKTQQKTQKKQGKEDQPLMSPGQCGEFYFERKSKVT